MNVITLTFDNGPDPEVTPQVLDTLRRHDVRSTFFVLGDKMRDRRKAAERAHDEGHWIGNHTYNHIVPLGMAMEPGIAASEIKRTEELIGDLAHPRRFFRPYGGGGLLDRRLLNREALNYLCDNAYTCILWNVIAEDWVRTESWVDPALQLSSAQPHALVVLHDLPTGAMRHLDRFISAAKDRGAVFRQEFPRSCVAIERGELTAPIEPYVSHDTDLAAPKP